MNGDAVCLTKNAATSSSAAATTAAVRRRLHQPTSRPRGDEEHEQRVGAREVVPRARRDEGAEVMADGAQRGGARAAFAARVDVAEHQRAGEEAGERDEAPELVADAETPPSSATSARIAAACRGRG